MSAELQSAVFLDKPEWLQTDLMTQFVICIPELLAKALHQRSFESQGQNLVDASYNCQTAQCQTFVPRDKSEDKPVRYTSFIQI